MPIGHVNTMNGVPFQACDGVIFGDHDDEFHEPLNFIIQHNDVIVVTTHGIT